MLSNLFAAVGAAVALAGCDKLAGMRGYTNMFRNLGWSDGNMRTVATAEIAGGLLMMPRFTRPLGAVLVAGSSAAMLGSEVTHGQPKLALPRGVIMLLAIAAVTGGLTRTA